MKSARGDGQQLDVGAGERGAGFSEYLAEHLCALGGLLNSEVELCRSVGFPNVRTDEPDVRVAGEFEDEFFSLPETRCRFHDQSVGEVSRFRSVGKSYNASEFSVFLLGVLGKKLLRLGSIGDNLSANLPNGGGEECVLVLESRYDGAPEQICDTS